MGSADSEADMTTDTNADCTLAGAIAEALRDASEHLAKRWLYRIAERVDIEPEMVFPAGAGLDGVPHLIDGIADFIENPVNEIGADTLLVNRAMEIGALRHDQGFDVYEILKEYELLGGILFAHLARMAGTIAGEGEQSNLLACGQRLFRAISLIQQATTVHFLRLADEKKREREEQLRAFNRAVSHEIKNQIGTVVSASETLQLIPFDDWAQREKITAIIVRNARVMQHTVENLVALTRTDNDARQHHHLQLALAAREAARQLRENSRAANVEIRLENLPEVEVNAAAVELCVTNYLSNAIKYADPSKAHRFVIVTGSIESSPYGGREIVVRVRDNGLGVPREKRGSLFERFYRAHTTATHAEGTGLGLSIVSETVASLGGRAWAEFPPSGSVFAFSLPYRRHQSSDRNTRPAIGNRVA
jgi:signal transduction histidine kinase